MTGPKIPSHEGHVFESLVTLEPLWESRRGYIAGTDGEGRPVVDFEGSPIGPRVARKAVPLDAEALQAAIRSRREVELRFEDGDARYTIIVAVETCAEGVNHIMGGSVRIN